MLASLVAYHLQVSIFQDFLPSFYKVTRKIVLCENSYSATLKKSVTVTIPYQNTSTVHHILRDKHMCICTHTHTTILTLLLDLIAVNIFLKFSVSESFCKSTSITTNPNNSTFQLYFVSQVKVQFW